jgi:Novel STAND NTPase 3
MVAIISHPVESFARGRDGGVDLRYTNGRTRMVGQAKHYINSTYSDLVKAVRSEKVKLDERIPKPTRYLLFTTQPLTPARKSELKGLLTPYCKRVGDIYGVEDIEGIIAKNPDIETHHYKLWLASVKVLERIFGNAVLTRSEMRVEDITERAKLFVPHQKLGEAESILKEEHCLIVSGEPGIGKTTMAEMLALRLLEAGYRTHFVANVEELERQSNSDWKQLFIYDDFLGRTNFREAPDASSQERLFAYMRWIRKKPGKYLILTTREYLYREARAANERLLESRSDLIKCVLDVSGYTRITRAQILYNHIYWTPGIEREDLREFAEKKGYWEIIDHPNFNPRWIADTLNRIAPAVPAREGGDDSWT